MTAAMIDRRAGAIAAERDGRTTAWRMAAARQDPVIQAAVRVLRDADGAAAVVGAKRPKA